MARRPVPTLAALFADPRHYQIAVLASLLAWGVGVLAFPVPVAQIAATLGGALAAQALLSRRVGIPFDPRSPLITGLSLCLLLRVAAPWLAAVAAAAAMASKFLLRRRDARGGKHIFNPANFGIVALLLATDRAWVSPGQWGSAAVLGLALAAAGSLVVYRAERADVTWAFFAAWAAVLFGRALWLGDPLAIPLHQLSNGALLIFGFFMISDPKTTPDSRPGRAAYAALVAAVGGWMLFGLQRSDGLFWALAATAPTVPLFDRLLPGRRYRWPGALTPHFRKETAMPRPLTRPAALLFVLLALCAAPAAEAFCGFYVARADARLFNRASQVVLVRDGDRTVISMASDYRGDPAEFALVVPVPTFIEREQIHVAEMALIDHLDAYSAPRLVEYFDEDPCARRVYEGMEDGMLRMQAPEPAAAAKRARALGVTIEATYTVGEYDILILSAKESNGLVTWLSENGYRMPQGAGPVVGSYLKQGMRFFVAKVNLEEQARHGLTTLRPLQVAYETPKFMLPIRLGTVNADGPQELFVYALTRRGRVETTNYRTVRLPSGQEIPPFVKSDFAAFYRDLFTRQVEREQMRAVFLEYAWDMAWCDPCAADPLSRDELRQLGVFWLDERSDRGAAQDVFVTRLHLRYDRDHFPEDLRFHETADRANFQGRYVLRHPFSGEISCPAADAYRRQLAERQEQELHTLADLTGWPLPEIRRRAGLPRQAPPEEEEEPWWKKIWGR